MLENFGIYKTTFVLGDWIILYRQKDSWRMFAMCP